VEVLLGDEWHKIPKRSGFLLGSTTRTASLRAPANIGISCLPPGLSITGRYGETWRRSHCSLKGSGNSLCWEFHGERR
jgi:hypothetical protein